MRAILALVMAWSAPGDALGADRPPRPAIAGVTVSFKLDPRLTRSLYMGDRWVSPAAFNTLSAAAGRSITVEARAQGFDAVGRRWRVSPEWIASDTEMVTVSPARGAAVKLTVRRPGASTVTVKAGQVTRELIVRSVRQGDTWRVDILQPVSAPPAPPARPRKALTRPGLKADAGAP